MTLYEHIHKAEEDAKMAEFDTEWGIGNYFIDRTEALEYAKECRQLAEWLKELKQLREQVSCSENSNKWIPVSERLPKSDEYIGDVARYYLVQNEFGDMMVARYRHSEYWQQIHQLKPIGDEIVAWMPLPEPYKASPTGSEGSDKE